MAGLVLRPVHFKPPGRADKDLSRMRSSPKQESAHSALAGDAGKIWEKLSALARKAANGAIDATGEIADILRSQQVGGSIEAPCFGAIADVISQAAEREKTLARRIMLLEKENQRLIDSSARLAQAMHQAKGATLETIYRLVLAAEYKDEDTSSHIQRMSLYSAAIARAMGLPEPEVEQILYASPMHDVGKIGIPDWILLKPGKLDDGEWEIMKTHTTIGAGILENSSSDLICMAEGIALSHHERWEGRGYPYGISGSEIPLPARITSVADVFDALTSKRPYKEAFPAEKAFGIIREERGSQFDPAVVDAFFSVQDIILEIQRTHRHSDFKPMLP
jgi:response regulator RpfG family c-di-GMP phosphodiesterase